MARWIIGWLAVGALGLGALACGSGKVRCTVANCSGCCDSTGACVTDLQTPAVCGLNGATCAACSGGNVCSHGTCQHADGGAGGGSAGGSGGGQGGGGGAGGGAVDAGDDCSTEAKLVYVVDQDGTFSSFDPSRVIHGGNPFTDLGHLNCPAALGASPFSMAVDRTAGAWVIYDSGELFAVNITHSLACVKTTFAAQSNVAKFGMGFVSNSAGSTDETLYISGSPLSGSMLTTKFGTLSTVPPYTLSLRGTMSGSPELTGTGDAKLWAFFPNVAPPRVAQLDKSNGAETTTFEASATSGSPQDWAFAFWGGDFWIFLKRTIDNSTNVWRMNGQTGAILVAVPDTGRRIVGAGVSTCAPIIIN